MEECIARGRKKILAVITAIISFNIITSLINILAFGLEDIHIKIIRFCLLSILCYFLYKQKSWAKTIIVILLIFSMIFLVFSFFQFILAMPIAGLFSALIFALYLWIIKMLVSDTDVSSYLEWSDCYKKSMSENK